MIRAIRPLLLRYALASQMRGRHIAFLHPQGAGIAVIAATLLVAGAVIAWAGATDPKVLTVFGATMFLATVGLADDIKSIAILPRLVLQAIAVATVVFAAAGDRQIVPACPLWLERGLLLLAGLWFVNLVNFMDGLDWMTLAEVVPVTGALVVLGSLGELPAPPTVVAAALLGAMAGFAPFNRPVAKIFLGDVGSLPIGLLLGWCLLQLAYHHYFVAALLLPLYYLSDATVTLLRRLAKREPFWTAHRTHFYQRATDNGYTVWRVVERSVRAQHRSGGTGDRIDPDSIGDGPRFAFRCRRFATALVMYRFSQPQFLRAEVPLRSGALLQKFLNQLGIAGHRPRKS